MVESVKKNGIALKGVIAVPEVFSSDDLQNLNQNFRTHLDLYANVVKVSFGRVKSDKLVIGS